MVEFSLYRAVTCNQETPFEENPDYPFPKYLSSFRIGSEITLKEEKNGNVEDEDDQDETVVCKGIRKLHQHQHKHNEKCELPFCGISVKNSSKCHNGIAVTAFKEVLDRLSSNERPPTSRFQVSWIYDAGTRKNAMKSFQRQVERRNLQDNVSVYACYRLDTTQMSNTFKHFHDGIVCRARKEDDHVTIYPAEEEVTGEYVKITTRSYLYCQDLLAQGWSPCCFQVRCEAEPKEFDESFDPQCWKGCQIIFKYLNCAIDCSQADFLSDLLSLMDKGDYHVSVLRDVGSSWIAEADEAIHSLMLDTLEFDDAEHLSLLRGLLKEVMTLKEGPQESGR
jgi:hypothetical protein